jgi:hypothetical protein
MVSLLEISHVKHASYLDLVNNLSDSAGSILSVSSSGIVPEPSRRDYFASYITITGIWLHVLKGKDKLQPLKARNIVKK